MTNKSFQNVFFIFSAFVFLVTAIRTLVLPFSYDETATFFYYIQSGSFLPYISPVDATNHVLNSFLAWICFHLFGDSPFSLRLPNLLALVVLIVAVYKLAGRLTHTSSKIILITGLLLSFYWLGFFSMCRGYGISMSLMALAFSYVPDYFEHKKLPRILIIYLLLDLAICANLALIIAVTLITVLVCFFQLYHRRFFKLSNIAVLLIHAVVILFWVKYSFFLQNQHHLYAGQGNSYWTITFASLIYAVIGIQNFWINASIVSIYVGLMAIGCFFLIKNAKSIQSNRSTFILFLVILLNGLIIGFYLLKKLYGVNFPEDRAALFFYVLFILSVAFLVDTMKPYFSNLIAVIIFVLFATHFALSLNFSRHPLAMYDVMPQRFYDRLLQEQKQHSERITIGGSKFRELFYEFMNYRHNGALNVMDVPDNNNNSMIMNADYYIALKKDNQYYAPYYREIDSDKGCNFVLLERKNPLTRKLLFVIGKQDIEISKAYNEFRKDISVGGLWR